MNLNGHEFRTQTAQLQPPIYFAVPSSNLCWGRHRALARVGERKTKRIFILRPFAEKQPVSVKDSSHVSIPSTAPEAIEAGLQAFQAGNAEKAYECFSRAMELKNNEEEGQAAAYNSACALTRLKRYKEAADQVLVAVNDYGLKLDVASKDPDLKDLRERREWLDVLETARGGLATSTFISMRAETKAPFRLARIFLFGGLAAGAGLGLFIITIRLIAALKGGDGAPDLADTIQNFAINITAFSLLAWLTWRDVQSQERDKRTIEREEMLGRLQIQIGGDKVVPLARFRGSVRPVLVAGSKSQVERALKAAVPLLPELRERGISVVPLIISDADPEAKLVKLKKEWGETGGAAGDKGFGKAEKAPAVTLAPQDRKWELKAYNLDEWRDWLQEQKAVAGVQGGQVYVQVQLDGTVRTSGVGSPPWDRFVGDLDTLDSIRTKFTDGIGTSR